MIEREFIKQNIKEHQIEEFIGNSLRRVGHAGTRMIRTPLGEKIIIYASRPGLVVGRKGENIKKLTKSLKKEFSLKNPQIEINEVEDFYLDAQIVAERIADSLERLDSSRFKAVGHKTMADVMGAGALGIEITISGKIPSSRAKTWRFYKGYLKKCGDISIEGVKRAYTQAQLKSGTIGIQVRIMPPDINLPDKIRLAEDIQKEEKVIEGVEEKKDEKDESIAGKGKSEKKAGAREVEAGKENKEMREISEGDKDKEKRGEKKEKKKKEKADEGKANKGAGEAEKADKKQ